MPVDVVELVVEDEGEEQSVRSGGSRKPENQCSPAPQVGVEKQIEAT